MKWFTCFTLALTLAACSSNSTSHRATANSATGASDVGATGDVGATVDVGSNPVTTVDAGGDASAADAGTTDVTPDVTPPGAVYVDTTDPYAMGALNVARSDIAHDSAGPPVDVIVWAPTDAGTYPLVVFQHGFLLKNSYYSTMLSQVASHGFVVVAPQMYAPTFSAAPSTADEATLAESVWDWARTSVAGVVDPAVAVATDHFGLAGHSRGGKVVWLGLEDGYQGVVAAAGVDPVDGTGGPLGNEPRVLDGGLDTNVPSLFIGSGLGGQAQLGMACAPDGDNYAAFFDAAASPSYEAVGTTYGHLDMLDDQTSGCGFVCSACAAGPSDGGFRSFSAGLLVAFFRLELQGDSAAMTTLTSAATAPIEAQFAQK